MDLVLIVHACYVGVVSTHFQVALAHTSTILHTLQSLFIPFQVWSKQESEIFVLILFSTAVIL